MRKWDLLLEISTKLDRIVVRQSSSVLQLLPSEDESLLLGWDSLFVLDQSFDVLDSDCGLCVQGDRPAEIWLFFLGNLIQLRLI